MFISYLVLFCSFVFQSFSIAITSLGEEIANLSAFRTFIPFVLVWFCRFPLPLGVREGLRFVIVAFPGLFSYLFCKLRVAACFPAIQNPSHEEQIFIFLEQIHFQKGSNRLLTVTSP